LKQGSEGSFQSEYLLGQIVKLSIRARDLEGAAKLFQRDGKEHSFNSTNVDLAEALARDGQRDRAFALLRLTPDNARPDYWSHGTVQLQWIEYLIQDGRLDDAAAAVSQTSPIRYRQEGEVKLAMAFAKCAKPQEFTSHLKKAISLGAHLADDSDRVSALMLVVEAYIEIGHTGEAKETIRLLATPKRFKDGWATVSALSQCAVVTANLHDVHTSRRLFHRAIEAYTSVDKLNRMNSLQSIAEAQADVGFIDDALRTAAMIKHSASDFTVDGYREAALFQIACKQSERGELTRAVNTAASIKNFVQYREDALDAIVECLIRKDNLEAAASTTDQFLDSMRKVAARLRVAAAYSRSDKRLRAHEIAERVKLKPAINNVLLQGANELDYRRPETWGVDYNDTDYSSNGTRAASLQRKKSLASAAMTLAQALGIQPTSPYASSFKDFDPEVVGLLARTHAKTGSPTEALAWARKVGSGEKIAAKSDYDAEREVERRVMALCGVAAGILDRHGVPRSHSSEDLN